MNLRISAGLMFVVAGLCLSSCQKPDKPIALPEKGTSQHATVDMGEDYLEQFFYNIENGQIVHTSFVNSWDLAFEASPAGYHVFMNGAKTSDFYVYNTHKTNLADVKDPPAISKSEWGYDAPCGTADSTYIGNWRQANGMSKNEVYVIKWSADGLNYIYYKMILVSVSSDKYIISYGYFDKPETKVMTIPKDDNYNFTYFTFDDGGKIIQPEPPKNTWDIVFTRYRHIYYDYPVPDANFFPYTVMGVLLNPYNTTAVADSVTGYENIKTAYIANAKFCKDRNVIGFDWKSYDYVGTFKYTVHKNKCYIVKDQDDKFWKLHFIDYYSNLGVKGSPSFEYERLQ